MKTTSTLVNEIIKPARTIKKETTIVEVIKIMKDEKLDLISVVDENQKLIGAVTENNFIKLVKHDPPTPFGDPIWFDMVEESVGKKSVETIMTTNITTISPNDTLDAALKVMSSSSYKILHVVDNTGKLLGIITLRDIFEKLLGV
ncbi:MAG: CBS domain-containing protein [Candidatus Aenigmatarchaeota archaeon]